MQGTIDSPDIRDQFRIMEGGEEAFAKRKSIYSIWDLKGEAQWNTGIIEYHRHRRNKYGSVQGSAGQFRKYCRRNDRLVQFKRWNDFIWSERQNRRHHQLDYSQIQSTGNRVATIANDLIRPQIFIFTEVVSLSPDANRKISLWYMWKEGTAKPYKDRNGTIWIKQGGDKRRLTDNNEQVRLSSRVDFCMRMKWSFPTQVLMILMKKKSEHISVKYRRMILT